MKTGLLAAALAAVVVTGSVGAWSRLAPDHQQSAAAPSQPGPLQPGTQWTSRGTYQWNDLFNPITPNGGVYLLRSDFNANFNVYSLHCEWPSPTAVPFRDIRITGVNQSQLVPGQPVEIWDRI